MEQRVKWEPMSRFWNVVVLIAIVIGLLFMANDWWVIAKYRSRPASTSQPSTDP